MASARAIFSLKSENAWICY